MEREKSSLPSPKESFIIAGEKLNIRRHLDGWQGTPHYLVDEMKPGDDQAIRLIRMFKNNCVTSEEYFTTMPRLLKYAQKKEGGWDADFLDVARHLFAYTKLRMEKGDTNDGVEAYRARRTAYYANVYGKLEMVQALVWNDPKMAAKKEELIGIAKSYIEKNPDLVC